MSVIPYEVHPLQLLMLRTISLFANITAEAVEARGVAHVALSGKRIPKALFQLLATAEWQARIPWAHTHIWWVDERCVRPDDPESNYGMVRAHLLRHLPVVITHRIHCEESPWQAAYKYEQALVSGFNLWGEATPRFDLILLGIDENGHIASFVSGSPALTEHRNRVTVTRAAAALHDRVSLTLPVLTSAANSLFLAIGANKGPVLTKIITQETGLPASQARPRDGNELWLLDTAAQQAAGLPLLHQCPS